MKQKLEAMETLDVFDRAVIFAAEKHSGALRKGTNIPYLVHPLEAAAIAATLTDDREILAAAVLHDVIEDTDATVEELKQLFGERVAELVCADSEDKREERPAAETWELRKQETLDFTETASQEEKIIILADKLSNLRAMYRDYLDLGEPFWGRFNQKDKRKHGWYYDGICERLAEFAGKPVYEEYRELVGKVFE